MNLPNKLTVLRVVLVVPMMVLILTGYPAWAAVIFLVASITDFLDGYIARKNDLVTDFGKIMDPLADKMLIFGALLGIMEAYSLKISWVIMIILMRELLISGIRIVAASRGRVIAASWWGKAKTVVQMIALFMMILFCGEEGVMADISLYVMYLSVILTVISGYIYVRDNIFVFKKEEK